MAELIDILFLFWLLVAAGVYLLGSIYENHLRERAKAEAKRQKRLDSLSRADDWSRPSNHQQTNNYQSATNTTIQHNSSQQFNSSSSSNNNSYNHSVNAAYDHQHQLVAGGLSSAHTDAYDGRPVDSFDHIATSRRNQQHNLTHSIRQTDFGLQHDAAAPTTGAGLGYGAAANLSRSAASGQQQHPANQSIPTATGFGGDCVDWVNRILFLFYSQSNKYGPIIAENVYRSLNEKLANILSSSVEFSDWTIEFQSIDLNSSTEPELKNVRTESESDKSVSAVCKIYNQRLVCQLKLQQSRPSSIRAFGSSQQQRDDESLNYELALENLEGKLKSVAMFSDKLIVVQFMEKPDTKILLRQLGRPTMRSPMNEDALVSLILQALTQVVVDLYFGDEPEFPQFIKSPNNHQAAGGYRNKLSQLKGSANEIKRQIKHDFLGALSLGAADYNKERKIFVKLLRAKNINYNQNVTCILELDQPRQHAISSTRQGSNPFWDEHFLFLINNEKSSPTSTSNDKLTLELWDSLDPALIKAAKQQLELSHSKQKSKLSSGQKFIKNELIASGKFLGLARLSIDELRQNPVQKQTLMLQSKSTSGDESNMIGGMDLVDSIGGELHLELMFLEHAASAASHQTPLQKSASANSISSMPSAAAGDQGDVVSIDRKLTHSGYLITTTTIAKPAAPSSRRAGGSKDRLSPAGGATLPRNYSPVSSAPTEQSGTGFDMSIDGQSAQVSQRSGDQTSQQQQQPDGLDQDDSRPDSRLSRSRSRSRGFLNALKRRFSFSRIRRSRSVSVSASPSFSRADSSLAGASGQPRNLDAISIDSRSRASSEVSLSAGRAKSMPASRDSNEVPTIVINKSRLSDASSAFAFVHPKSQLVIECREPKLSDGNSRDKTLLRHYAIPDDPASERRWRRRGVKLHLFNEHQFVACHLAGSSTCHLCGRVFSRRPGKQGYKCRNCHLLSHKQCHVKVDHNCPYATKDGLKLEYIDADPPASLVLERAHSASSQRLQQQQQPQQQQQQKPNRPTSRLTMKSISVEVDDR